MKKPNTIDLFALGMILIPFDNLIIAPSSGWATVAPFFFLGYVLLNVRHLGKAFSLVPGLMYCMVLLPPVQVLLVAVNGFRAASFLDSLGTLALGVSFFLAMILRYRVFERDINEDAQRLYGAYVVSFCYGIARLVAVHFAPFVLPLFQFLEKRSYSRLAFSFTEPSFVSMHIIGVLWLMTWLVSDRKLAKKMLWLGCGFLALEGITLGSARCIVDMGVFALLYLAKSMLTQSKHVFRNGFLLACGVVAVGIVLVKVPRLANILRDGVNADASGASRWFRINAAVRGFRAEPVWAFLGRGMGNMILPLRLGFDQALQDYTNTYMAEINWLSQAKQVDSLFSMPVKILSDFGLPALAALVLYIVRRAGRRRLDLFAVVMVLWLYVQFDSYAFYTLWMLLFIVKFYDRESMGLSFYERISATLNRFKLGKDSPAGRLGNGR